MRYKWGGRLPEKGGIAMKTKLMALLLALAMVLALCGCAANAAPASEGSQSAPSAGEGSAVSVPPTDVEPVSVQAEYPAPPEDWEAYQQMLEENPVDADFLAALNRFALRSSAQLLSGEGGCVSPLSIYYALALAAEGAQGDTARELYALLGADGERLGEQCSNLFRRLYAEDEEGTLLMANSLWLDEEVQGSPVRFREDYLKKAVERYYASVFTVDFADAATGEKIGDWIYENTREKLRFEPEANADQMMAILNTVYFNSPWRDPFVKELTQEDRFTCADGTEQTAPFMHRSETGRYYRGEDYSAASLSLCKGRMNFFLPDEGVDVHSLLSHEDLFTAPETADGDKTYRIEWSVPRFTCESKWSVLPALQALGVKLAFSGDADFSALSDTPAHITAIEQGTRIGVDEDGVEAAAYTYLSMETQGALMEEPEVVEMNLNRPFLYTLTSQEGAVLFVGICEGM